MKKLAIAGASVALAAMPVVGVFAAPTLSHTDTLNLNIAKVCTFGTVTSGAANDDDATTHGLGANNPTGGAWTNDSYSANVAVGNTYAALATTTFTVRCNNADGYTVKAKAGSVQGTGENAKGVLASGTNYIYSGDGNTYNAATAGTSYWNFSLATTEASGVAIETGYETASALPANDTTVVVTGTNGNVQAGQKFTATYGAGIDNHQPAGTYTGTVVYTLVPAAN